jgi:hypothetical protein
MVKASDFFSPMPFACPPRGASRHGRRCSPPAARRRAPAKPVLAFGSARAGGPRQREVPYSNGSSAVETRSPPASWRRTANGSGSPSGIAPRGLALAPTDSVCSQESARGNVVRCRNGEVDGFAECATLGHTLYPRWSGIPPPMPGREYARLCSRADSAAGRGALRHTGRGCLACECHGPVPPHPGPGQGKSGTVMGTRLDRVELLPSCPK